jgi:hypothetical protein
VQPCNAVHKVVFNLTDLLFPIGLFFFGLRCELGQNLSHLIVYLGFGLKHSVLYAYFALAVLYQKSLELPMGLARLRLGWF